MLSLGGFFLALFLGDGILGVDHSQPVGTGGVGKRPSVDLVGGSQTAQRCSEFPLFVNASQKFEVRIQRKHIKGRALTLHNRMTSNKDLISQ